MQGELLRSELLSLRSELNEIRGRLAEMELPGGVQIGKGPDMPEDFPFRLYVDSVGPKVCMRPGVHVWWRQYTGVITMTTLEETGSSAWGLASSTIYVKRVRNADDTATVTLHRTTDSAATVLAGVTNSETRFIIGTVSTSTGITQWRRQQIEEYRVS